jgi:hypothetical protein
MKLLAALALACVSLPALDVEITLPANRAARPLDGRLLVLFSTDASAEPRFQINDSPKSQIVFGSDIDGFRPGATHLVSSEAYGYPVRRMSDLKPGEYTAQVVFDLYETFQRADGHVVKLHAEKSRKDRTRLATYIRPA